MAPLERLKKRKEFLAVAGSGLKAVTPGMILQARPQRRPSRPQTASGEANAEGRDSRGAKPLPETSLAADLVADGDGSRLRIGFTASRKVGKAVDRNRAKRRLRALAEEILPGEAVLDYDYVLIARTETVTRPFAELRQDMVSALRRLGLSLSVPAAERQAQQARAKRRQGGAGGKGGRPGKSGAKSGSRKPGPQSRPDNAKAPPR